MSLLRAMNIKLLVGATLAALGSLPAIRAQAQWPTVPAHTRTDASDGDYGMWAAGARYKAAFNGGMTFVPYLGTSQPHNETWSWATTRVVFGEQDVSLLQPPRPDVKGERVAYHLGSIIERYDVRAEGLEQTFFIANVPAAGDLVITGTVRSTLHAQVAKAAVQSVTFSNPAGQAILSYGSATAIDAKGQRMQMTTAVNGDHIELRLAGTWLANATLPIVVDPLIQVVAVQTEDVVHTDTVRDANGGASDSLWVCYERAASASDSDFWFLRLDDAATSTTLAYADLSAAWSTTEPCCAFLAGSNTAVAAWTHESPAGTRTVRWVGRGQFFTPERTVPPPAGANDWRPDIGGTDHLGVWNAALLVFQRELNGGAFAPTDDSLVLGVFVDPTLSSAHQTSPDFFLAGGGFDNERPTVNQQAEATPDHTWLVGWQKHLAFPNPAQATWDIAVRKVGTFGTLTHPSELPSVPMRHDMTPRIAGQNGRYLIAFTASDRPISSAKPDGAAGHELHSWRVDWPTLAPWPSYPHPVSLLFAAPTAELEATGNAFDEHTQSHWLIATRNVASNERAAFTTGFEGSVLRIDQVAAGSVGFSPANAGITYDRKNQRYVAATGTSDGIGGGQLEVAMLALPSAVAPTTSAPSCSPAGIAWSGSQVIGAEHSRIVVAGAEAGALHVMIASLAPTQLPLAGVGTFLPNCSLLVDTGPASLLGTLPLAIGSLAQWNLPLPATLPAFDLVLQDMHTANGLSSLASSARMTVPLVR